MFRCQAGPPSDHLALHTAYAGKPCSHWRRACHWWMMIGVWKLIWLPPLFFQSRWSGMKREETVSGSDLHKVSFILWIYCDSWLSFNCQMNNVWNRLWWISRFCIQRSVSIDFSCEHLAYFGFESFAKSVRHFKNYRSSLSDWQSHRRDAWTSSANLAMDVLFRWQPNWPSDLSLCGMGQFEPVPGWKCDPCRKTDTFVFDIYIYVYIVVRYVYQDIEKMKKWYIHDKWFLYIFVIVFFEIIQEESTSWDSTKMCAACFSYSGFTIHQRDRPLCTSIPWTMGTWNARCRFFFGVSV